MMKLFKFEWKLSKIVFSALKFKLSTKIIK